MQALISASRLSPSTWSLFIYQVGNGEGLQVLKYEKGQEYEGHYGEGREKGRGKGKKEMGKGGKGEKRE